MVFVLLVFLANFSSSSSTFVVRPISSLILTSVYLAARVTSSIHDSFSLKIHYYPSLEGEEKKVLRRKLSQRSKYSYLSSPSLFPRYTHPMIVPCEPRLLLVVRRILTNPVGSEGRVFLPTIFLSLSLSRMMTSAM